MNDSPLNLNLPQFRLLLFLFIWLVFGIFINSGNMNDFDLHQVGVEAIAERGTFYLDGTTTPKFVSSIFDDLFRYEGHLYAAKQPGQFMIGALVYFILAKLGITYTSNYLLASALVTFFTATLFASITAICIFNLAYEWSKEGSKLAWALTATLIYCFGTIAFPYSGLPHHDVIATGLFIIAFYVMYQIGQDRVPSREIPYSLLAGLLLGLTITTSMLPFFMVIAAGIYFIALRKFKLLPVFILGGLLGIAPLLYYNYTAFGNPLVPPNIMGDFNDTYFFLDSYNAIKHLNYYAIQIMRYVLIFPWGIFGLFLIPKDYRREKIFLLGAAAVLVFYIVNIETLGGCQYGPRYLLPVMPIAALGLTGLQYTDLFKEKKIYLYLFIVTLIYSAFGNLIGALNSSMYCFLNDHALLYYLNAMSDGGTGHTYPLALVLMLPALVVLGMLVMRIRSQRNLSSQDHLEVID